MDISVVIPVYNVAAYIEECLVSLCEQTFLGELELILVDDCGQDESMAIAHRVLDTADISVRWLKHTHNRGLSAARNTGLEVAQGKYVFYVDSDDIVAPCCLELLFNRAEEMAANVVAGAYETFGEGVDPCVGGQLGGYVMAWNKLYLRSFLLDNDLRFIEGLIHEDVPWNYELTAINRKFTTVSEVTYRYRIRENSLQTHRDYQRHFEAYCRILQTYADIIGRRHLANQCEYLEQQKALYFTMTIEHGTSAQLHHLYQLIRTLSPRPPFSKPDIHYYMPEPLGFFWYKKFHRYHLC